VLVRPLSSAFVHRGLMPISAERTTRRSVSARRERIRPPVSLALVPPLHRSFSGCIASIALVRRRLFARNMARKTIALYGRTISLARKSAGARRRNHSSTHSCACLVEDARLRHGGQIGWPHGVNDSSRRKNEWSGGSEARGIMRGGRASANSKKLVRRSRS